MNEKNDVIEVATEAGYFRVFLQALQSTGLTQTLKETGPYTIFAPIDDAFLKIPKASLETLFRIENRESLQALLRNHIVLEKLTGNELKLREDIRSAKGESLKINSRAGLWVNEAQVLTADLLATNGVLHSIDAILISHAQVAGVS